MTEKYTTLSTWTYNGIEFSTVESVANFLLASGAPDTRLMTGEGFRTYKWDRKHVFIEVTEPKKERKAIDWAQAVYASEKKPKKCNDRYIHSLEEADAFEYEMHLYGPEYVDQCRESRERSCSIRIVDVGRDFIDGFSSNRAYDAVDLYDEDMVM